ncbi:MAG: hypothetical protein RL291_2139 [Pseudomonadota bacterium]
MRSVAASALLVARPLRARTRLGFVPMAAISIAALALSACASKNNQYHAQPSGVMRQAAVPSPIPRPKIEIEDDGKPVQSPPARIMRPDEDDPTQPWSPNYGRTKPAMPRTAEAITQPPRPAATTAEPRPADVHPARGRPMTEYEIIARAVAQQELADQAKRR